MYNAWGSFLLGLPDLLGRLHLSVAPYTTRMRSYSFYVRDQWQVTNRLTLAYGTRYEYFPIPTRADRGLERYNPATNMMEIGGVGAVPRDLGIEFEKGLFAPRVGVTFRAVADHGDTWRVRHHERSVFAGAADADESPDPAEPDGPGAEQPFLGRPTAAGVPPIADPDLGNGIIPIPGNVTAFTLPDEFNRGYIKSWNAAVQKELRWGLVAEAAYVATRQIDQLGFLELNWSPIGGGQAGRQLNRQFGRTAQTRLVAPIGDTNTTRCKRGSIDASRTGSRSASATRCRNRPGSRARRAATGRRAS